MKVALISLYNREFAFGPRYLSAVLERAGHDCQLIFFKELTRHPQPEKIMQIFSDAGIALPPSQKETAILIDLLKKISPDLIGLNVSSPLFQIAAALTVAIKKELSVPVAWGGIHPTLLPKDCLKFADFSAIGEAEVSLPQLLEHLQQGRIAEKIRGFAYFDKNNNYLDGGPGLYVNDLDNLPFPDFYEGGNKHYISKESYSQQVPLEAEHINYSYNMMSSRGCPFRCSYCCNSVLQEKMKDCGKWIRRRSPESVIEELKIFTNSPNIEHVHFWDDVFTFNKKWIDKFSQLYRRQIGLPMTCYVHPLFRNRDILAKLKWAGLATANIGIQSGSIRTMNEDYDRHYDPQVLYQVAQDFKELDIMAHYDVLLDNPFESEEDCKKTLDMLLSFPRPFKLNTFSMCFFPETPFTKRALKEGKISESEVDGIDHKGVREFMSFVRNKEKAPQFWGTLISMTPYLFFPKKFISFVSNLKFLRKYPGLLVIPAQKAMILRRWLDPQRGYYSSFFSSRKAKKKKGGIIELKDAAYDRQKGLTFELANLGRLKKSQRGVLSLDIYPVYQGEHPKRHIAYFNYNLAGLNGDDRLKVRLLWPQASFKVNGQWQQANEKWLGSFKEEELYKLELLVYDKQGKAIDCIGFRADPEVVFNSGKGRFILHAMGL